MWFLAILDILVSSLVIGPCVVGFWRGTWEFMEAHRDSFPLYWTLWVSSALHLVFALLRDVFADYFQRQKRGLQYTLVSRCYIYVFAVCCATQWRSTWMILEEWFGYDDHDVLLCTIPCTVILFAFRLFSNTLAPPFCIAIDSKAEDVFVFPTMFNVSVSCI